MWHTRHHLCTSVLAITISRAISPHVLALAKVLRSRESAVADTGDHADAGVRLMGGRGAAAATGGRGGSAGGAASRVRASCSSAVGVLRGASSCGTVHGSSLRSGCFAAFGGTVLTSPRVGLFTAFFTAFFTATFFTATFFTVSRTTLRSTPAPHASRGLACS